MIEQKCGGWRSPKTPRLWIRTLEMYAFPRLGKVPVSEITSADVLESLSPLAREPEGRPGRPSVHPRRAGMGAVAACFRE
ncbi:MAG: hypothetical protein J4F37_13705 [Acidobacteria bacterium]|nr:hypothetical protein [Acidobacteriota bacterium]